MRAFHPNAKFRKRFNLKHTLFNSIGDLFFVNQTASHQLAQKLRNENIEVTASELNALGLLHEIEHYLLQFYAKSVYPSIYKNLEDFFIEHFGQKAYDDLLRTFCHLFPPDAVYTGKQSIDDFLRQKTQNLPNRFVILEEMLTLWLDNLNPAFAPLQQAIDPSELKAESVFADTYQAFEQFFLKAPRLPGQSQSLLEFLREPAKRFPHSVSAQLEFIKTEWQSYLGDYLTRLLQSLDFIKEEQKLRFDPGMFGPGPSQVPEFNEEEVERFSPDRDWMPELVLIAKSTYVWLDQLSKKYSRPINRLDQIPEEELERLARFGISGLWLIGIWERSRASQKIKQRTGNTEALASAYALYDYVVAEDLGGEQALQTLKKRADKFGIRLATDMVPNHTGIDSRWIVEHPDWFIQVSYPPFPSYTFNGPDLCDHPDVGIFIEDGYWNRTDAAVVFKRVHYPSGEVRYIYHGNDGTSMPWNDTAQLNYLLPQVREAVIQKILEIARQFPIIRFDAAMTLTKKHFQRLWFPEPGSGGDIPSRAQFAMSKEEFNKAFPAEFWREVVDRVQKEVPDTLLLAEAFWLMESYFVRTLGMHRVYNSAFMNMLKNEENDKYRQLIKNVLEFNPQILKRYVNFMNNPDEETAVVQFGKGDKYFGVCILMCTLPGLPMFGHGQLEGFSEKYGMEYRKAYWDEEEDPWLIQEHFRLIAPLLKKRYLFSDVENFFLFDVKNDNGTVNENVFAFSNRFNEERALVVYNNAYAPAAGWIFSSTAVRRNDHLEQKTLFEALALEGNDEDFILFQDTTDGKFYLRQVREFKNRGLYVQLNGYQFHVYQNFRIVQHSTDQPYGDLYRQLNGQGVTDIEQALKRVRFAPLLKSIVTLLDLEYLQNAINAPTVDDGVNLLKRLFTDASEVIANFEHSKQLDELEISSLLKPFENFSKIQKNKWVFFYKKDQKDKHVQRLLHFFNLPGGNELTTEHLFFYAFLAFSLLNKHYPVEKDLTPLQERGLLDPFTQLLSWYDAATSQQLLQIMVNVPQGLPFHHEARLKQNIKLLFEDSSVQQFTRVHHFENTLYFNKERFELLMFYLFLFFLLYYCTGAKECKKSGKYVSRFLAIKNIALKQGYRLEEFLKAVEKHAFEV